MWRAHREVLVGLGGNFTQIGIVFPFVDDHGQLALRGAVKTNLDNMSGERKKVRRVRTIDVGIATAPHAGAYLSGIVCV